MQTKITFAIFFLAASFAGLSACKKAPSSASPAETYRSLLIGSWIINQHGIDLDGDGKGEATEISALPPRLFSLMDFYEDATGMVYIQNNHSGTPVDTAIHFTWHIPDEQTRIHLLLDGQRNVSADILKLNKIHLVLEYESGTGTKEWLYLTKP